MNIKYKKTNKKDYTSRNRGITLIALVITIIVMLILAAVTISMALNGGLFDYAGRAARETEIEINKERDLANVESGLSTDDLINYYTSGPKDWVIAWVYKNNAWSNPYFKDKELEESLNIILDPNYSLNSEENVTGQIIAKLYNNGELNISGNGEIPFSYNHNSRTETYPWLAITHGEEGTYHWDESLDIYLNDNISKLVIEEGITSIPQLAFYNCRFLKTITIPNSLTSIEEEAFYECSGPSSITFQGTISEWNNISLGGGWNSESTITTIHCTDGDITL